MSNFFRNLRRRASDRYLENNSREAGEWFIRNIQNLNRRELLRDKESKQTPMRNLQIGSLYTFFYDPKTKEKLPFYDRFPLIFLVGPAAGGFYGLNLHYLPPRQRLIFFERLTDISTRDDRIMLSYQYLKSVARLRAFRYCFKRYLINHIQSNVLKIQPESWMVAVAIPSELFMKERREIIWQGVRV